MHTLRHPMARHTFSFIWCYLSIFTGSSWTHHCQGFLVYEGQDFIHYPNGNWKIQYSVHSQLTECIPGCSEGSKTTWPWQHLKVIVASFHSVAYPPIIFMLWLYFCLLVFASNLLCPQSFYLLKKPLIITTKDTVIQGEGLQGIVPAIKVFIIGESR